MNNSPIQELFLLETIETIFDASIYLYLIDGKKLFFKTNCITSAKSELIITLI
jgi:hypothetical protein